MTTMVQPGVSRIPRAAGPLSRSPLADPRRTASAPSKLEQLQAEYQQRLLREKEQKLIEMYERNTQQALQKTNVQNMQTYNRQMNTNRPTNLPGLPPSGAGMANKKAGSVRDFFNQRRNNENGWTNNNNNNEYWSTQNMRSPGAPRHPIAASHRGRDKGQPLAPIRQPNNQQKPDPNRFRPQPPIQANTHTRQPPFVPNEVDAAVLNGRLSPPTKEPLPSIPKTQGKVTNFQKWKREKANNARNMPDDIPVEIMETPKKPEKMSDFQKWQQEQDAQRTERIENHRKQQQQQQQPQPHPLSARYTPEQKRNFLMLKNRQGSFTQFSDDEEEKDTKAINTKRNSPRVDQDIVEKKKRELEEIIVKEKAELIQLQKERQRILAQEEREREEERARKAQIEEKERERERVREKERRERLKRQQEADKQAERERREEMKKQAERERQEEAKRRAVPKPKMVRKTKPSSPPPPDEDEGPEPPKIDHAAFYDQLASDAGVEQVNLSECSICGRKFATDRLEKHKKICAKSSNKKRKVFDPVKMRTEGTEQEQYAKALKERPPSPPPQKKNNWRKKHEDFIKTMKYNKKLAAIEASGGNVADLPPPPPSENPDYVQCPTCSRKFNQTAAERHIPRCKDIKSRPAPVRRRR